MTAAAVAAFVVAAGGSVTAQSAPAGWTVSSGDVRVRCRMTVGGSFDAVTSALSGTLRDSPHRTGAFEGALRVDLASLETGIGLRDGHLRGSYLEVERGPAFRHAVLAGITLREPLPDGRGRHETAFAGQLTLHGVERRVEGEATMDRRDGRMRVEATLSLSLEAFDIPPPRYLGVGVRDEVRLTVTFEAAPSGATGANGP
ncbi:MAG: YceI family protein [Acidobacteria bacterium]|nr:YceI family protein [Acidobacteriota bacterium]